MNGPERTEKIYRGWYIVASAFVILVIIYGARYSFGVFVKPMFAEYGWPMTTISLGASINLLVYASGGIIAGRLLDTFAPKWIMTAGVVTTALGFFMVSYARTPLGLYLSYGVLVGLGAAGAGMVVSGAAVGKWFVRRRGLAIGLASMGIGLGTMFMAPLAGYIVNTYGWRTGFRFIGLVTAVVGIAVAQLFMGQSGPEACGLLPDGEKNAGTSPNPAAAAFLQPQPSLRSVLRDSRFWLLAFCNILAVMTVMMTFVHQVPYAVNTGIDKIRAASALGLTGVLGVCGKFFFGWLSDRLRDAKLSAALGFLLMALGMTVLYYAKTLTLLYVFAAVYGFGYGSLAPVMPILVSDRFGRRILGSAYGMLIFFSTGFGGALGPILGGLIYDRTGTYATAWLLNSGLLFLVAVLVLFLKPAAQAPEK